MLLRPKQNALCDAMPNDKEDKWIVSLDGSDIPENRILGDIAFQEQFIYGKLYK